MQPGRHGRTTITGSVTLIVLLNASTIIAGESLLTNNTLTPPLAGQVAVVTGAGRGIGQAISVKLAELGAHVVVCGRSRPPLEKTAAAIQQNRVENNASQKMAYGQSSIIECDVTDRASVVGMARHIDNTFGRVDILVNNAGIAGASGPLHQLAPDTWDDVLNTNLRGAYYCIRSVAPIMIRGGTGHIVNISSLAGKNPVPNLSAYAASKWGLNGLSYSVAEELRPHNIRVSVICPGSVNTEFSAHPGKNAEKMLQASDVAHAVAMIVTQSPQSFASEILLRPTQKP
jgi:NAD(P)-dependent dehydrogenase (short-subunit alcohol dehydrogenase family)